MKKYLKNFELTEDFVRESVYQCLSRKRWKRTDTSYLIAEYFIKFNGSKNQNIYETAKQMKKIAIVDKTMLYPIVDFMCVELYKEIKERRIYLSPIRYQTRIDDSSGKPREIGISTMKQQCFDYIAVNCCQQMFMAKIGAYQCASLPQRGQIKAKRYIEKWIRKNPKQCRYICKCDIKKYYPSVNHRIIKRYLKRDIKNDDVLYLLFTLIDTYKQGLCIGSYLSQYLANYFLSYAYHYLDENCYKLRNGVRRNLIYKKVFYMDDILLIGSRKRDVEKAFKMLKHYLETVLELTIKDSWELFELKETRPIDMVGYKFYPKYTTVRRRIFKRANKVYTKTKNPANAMTLHDAYLCVSYYGYFKHSDSYKYVRKMKIHKTIKRAKELISRYARNDNNEKTT